MKFSRVEKTYQKFTLNEVKKTIDQAEEYSVFDSDFILTLFDNMKFISLNTSVANQILMLTESTAGLGISVNNIFSFFDKFMYDKVYFESEDGYALFSTKIGNDDVDVLGLTFVKLGYGRCFVQLLAYDGSCISIMFDNEKSIGDGLIFKTIYIYLLGMQMGMLTYFFAKKSDHLLAIKDKGLIDSCYDLVPYRNDVIGGISVH